MALVGAVVIDSEVVGPDDELSKGNDGVNGNFTIALIDVW